MLLSPDAFIHVPMLAGKIVEPEKSTFRVSLATFADWDRPGPFRTNIGGKRPPDPIREKPLHP